MNQMRMVIIFVVLITTSIWSISTMASNGEIVELKCQGTMSMWGKDGQSAYEKAPMTIDVTVNTIVKKMSLSLFYTGQVTAPLVENENTIGKYYAISAPANAKIQGKSIRSIHFWIDRSTGEAIGHYLFARVGEVNSGESGFEAFSGLCRVAKSLF